MGQKLTTPPFEVGELVTSRFDQYTGLLLKVAAIFPSDRFGSGYGALCVGALTGKRVYEAYVDSAWFNKYEDPQLSPYRVELLLRKSDGYLNHLAADAIKQLRLQKSPKKK